jgi:hypothetical protein
VGWGGLAPVPNLHGLWAVSSSVSAIHSSRTAPPASLRSSSMTPCRPLCTRVSAIHSRAARLYSARPQFS